MASTGTKDAERAAWMFEAAALELIKKGFFLLPCKQDKSPYTTHGLKDASDDPSVIRKWAREFPDAQIGIACAKSNLVVVDIDDGAAWDAHLVSLGVTEPATVQASTPSGGRHLYFRPQKGVIYPGRVCPGVDIRHNGYVLCPPSVAYSKRADRVGGYVWSSAFAEFADAPSWLSKQVLSAEREASLNPVQSKMDLQEMEELLEYVDPDCDYQSWVAMLMAVHDAIGGSQAGLELAIRWSQKGAKFSPGEVEKKWRSFKLGGGVGPATIAAAAKSAGAAVSEIAKRHRLRRLQGEISSPQHAEFDFAALDLTNVEVITDYCEDYALDVEGEYPEVSEAAESDGCWHAAKDTVSALGSEGAHSEPVVDPRVFERAEALLAASFDAKSAATKLTSRYLIKGWLQPSSLALLYGSSAVGKSFVALSIAHAISTGKPWNECKVMQGLVIYISAEGGAFVENRLVALGTGRSENLIVVNAAIDLHSNDFDTDALIYAVRQRTQGRLPVRLIIFDTLARSFGAGDENTSTDMNQVIKRATDVRDALDATVLLVHHSGKDRERGARGSSSLRAAVETEIEAKKTGETSTLEATKQRDLEAGAIAQYRLLTVELGTDEDGEPVTSCRAEFFAAKARDPDGASLARGRKQMKIFELLRAYLKEHGVERPVGHEDEPCSRRVVKREPFMEHAIQKLGTGDRKKDQRSIREAIERMLASGAILGNESALWAA